MDKKLYLQAKAVLEELGNKASGRFGKLEVVEIPDNSFYKIDEYVADLVNLDYFNMGIKLLVIYVIVLVLYMFVAYMVYSLKYIKDPKDVYEILK